MQPVTGVARAQLALAAAGLALFLVAAWRSAGMHHLDEYFQTVEFASEKVGSTTAAELPWEHAYRIRPYLQPAAYALAIRALRAAGEEAPATALLAFRLGSALLSFAALLLLWAALAPRVPDPRGRTWLLAACLFTFYLPYLSVRLSSECVSGALLAAGIAAWLLLEERQRSGIGGLAAGVLLGLAFEARYQLGLSIAGFGLWLLVVRRALRPLLALAAGFAAVAALGVVLDRWGYGVWTFTPWNYLRENLVAGRAAHFGTSPFWQYVVDLAVAYPPLPALAGAAVVAYWLRARRDLLTWTTLPLVVGHTLLAHKELRFFFPLAPLAAAMAALLFLDPALRPRLTPRVGRVLRPALALLVAADLAWLAASILRPATHDLTVQAAVWELATRSPDARFVVVGDSAEPFWDFDAHLATPFVRPPRWAPRAVGSWDEAERLLAAGSGPSGPVLAVSLLDDPPPPALRARHRVRLAAAAIPEWGLRFIGSRWMKSRLRAMWVLGP